ncbi:MAG TPA: transporter substrate-binding domain-containing protein [Bacteroidia bacterium]|jgi:membrane-bound lytic murein transglycosylase F|nr:transporter substrate-binding domain-containing protein [Bacteroidia bacterium]
MMVWRNYKILFALAFCVTSLLEVKRCSFPAWLNHTDKADSALTYRDLDQIKTSHKLVLLTENSSTTYFIYKGLPMGYEYEMIDSFAHSMHLELDVVVVKNLDNIFKMLDNCEGDIAADNITITNLRRKDVEFAAPLYNTRQVLIQRKPDNWQKLTTAQLEATLVKDPIQLADKQVYVRKGSSFYERLKDLSNEIGGRIDIVEIPGTETTEELIGDVAKGKIDYTVADENVAKIVSGYYDNLDINTPVSFPQKIAWAVRRDSPDLMTALNDWIKKEDKKKFTQIVYDKYFTDKQSALFRKHSEYFSLSGGKISPYDELIKKYCGKVGWDWKLLAAQIYQESQFDPKAQSWSGAYGLMQMLPSTSAQYNLDTSNTTAENSIAAGVNYLRQIDNYWAKFIPDKNDRIPFDLASYDVGVGHIIDARSLANKYGLDPNKWENNVAYFLLNESQPKYFNDPVVTFGYCRGQEAYQYVREILNRYSMYSNQVAYESTKPLQ